MENKELIGKNPQEPKYSRGDKVIINGKENNTIEKVEFSEKYNCYIYWFKDNGKLYHEVEDAIELLEEVEETKEHKLFTIQDLAEGKCAVINDGTMEELDFLLLKAVNRSVDFIGYSNFYIIDEDSIIGLDEVDFLPKQSVKDFLKQIELVSQGQNVLDNVSDVQESKDCIEVSKEQFEKAEQFFNYIERQSIKDNATNSQEPTLIEGIKESENKINIEYDWDFLKAQMNRMAKNKHKYPKNNWKKPMDVEQLKDALFRHVLEVMDNKFEDDGDEFGHLSAIALNAMMINYQLKNK